MLCKQQTSARRSRQQLSPKSLAGDRQICRQSRKLEAGYFVAGQALGHACWNLFVCKARRSNGVEPENARRLQVVDSAEGFRCVLLMALAREAAQKLIQLRVATIE